MEEEAGLFLASFRTDIQGFQPRQAVRGRSACEGTCYCRPPKSLESSPWVEGCAANTQDCQSYSCTSCPLTWSQSGCLVAPDDLVAYQPLWTLPNETAAGNDSIGLGVLVGLDGSQDRSGLLVPASQIYWRDHELTEPNGHVDHFGSSVQGEPAEPVVWRSERAVRGCDDGVCPVV